MLTSASSFSLEKEKEEMIVLKTRDGDFAYIPFQRFEAAAFENNLLRSHVDDLSSEVDDMSAKIQHMVSELELEKRRVAKWKGRADERRIYANRFYKDVCTLEDKLESSDRRFRNLVRRTNKRVRADHHRSKVAFTARVKEKKLLKSLVRSRHSVSMENQLLRAKIDALKALLVL
ncbi:hypothetical protein Tco_0758641 [Tanacetum coccineum]